MPSSRTWYFPYGGTRGGGTGLPTNRQFTGQRRESGLGFYDYVARQYDPALRRFLQADTIVPDPANPQSLNRYAYVLNNPLRYTDPTRHLTEEQINRWTGGMYDKLDKETRDMLLALHFGDLLYQLGHEYGRFWGKAELGDSGLQFSNGQDVFSFNDLLDLRTGGVQFGLVRPTGGDNWAFAYLPRPWTTPSGHSIFAPTNTLQSQVSLAQAEMLSGIPKRLRNSVTGAAAGWVIGKYFGQPVPSMVIGLVVGTGYSVVFRENLPGHQAGDEILEYWYDQGLWEVTTIRNNQVLETRWNRWWQIAP